MGQVALGNPANYTVGGMRFYFASDVSGQTTHAITAVTQGAGGSFTVAGDVVAEFSGNGAKISVSGSTANDGDYYVVSAVFTTETEITVEEDVPDATVDGDLELSRTAELYLGNVVTGEFSSDITFLDHFTAKSGTRTKDRSIVQELAVNLNVTMDEPDVTNMNRFMLGGDTDVATGTPEYQRFSPYTDTEKNGGCRLAGVSDTGNEFIWTIRRGTLKPDGAFIFNDQDWSQFAFILEVLDNSTEDTTSPFGYVDHYGTDQDIDSDKTLLPDA